MCHRILGEEGGGEEWMRELQEKRRAEEERRGIGGRCESESEEAKCKVGKVGSKNAPEAETGVQGRVCMCAG